MDYEVKNRRTGKIYWMSKKGVDQLRTMDMIKKYIITEIKALKTITSPKDFKLIKNDAGRKESTK